MSHQKVLSHTSRMNQRLGHRDWAGLKHTIYSREGRKKTELTNTKDTYVIKNIFCVQKSLPTGINNVFHTLKFPPQSRDTAVQPHPGKCSLYLKPGEEFLFWDRDHASQNAKENLLPPPCLSLRGSLPHSPGALHTWGSRLLPPRPPS